MASKKEPLSVTHPELAEQASGWDPTTVSHGSHSSVEWKCELGHSWNAIVKNRVKYLSGCPFCSGRKAFSGFNDLATTHPELAEQAVDWDPTTLTSHSGQKVDWRCQSGHVWKATPATRSRGHGCPMCSGHTAITGVNDLATTHPELAAQALGWDPTTLSAGSNKTVEWKCHLGHIWKTQVCNRSIGSGCPFCGRSKVLAGFNDLATTHPELAAQADGWDPTQILAGTKQKREWICDFGHQWSSAINSRASGVGCPICVGAKVLAGFNDLATTHPELAAQADGWDPTTINQGSDRKVSWRCEIGHIWDATVASRSYGNGCPTCANQRVLAGYNDLATTNPELAEQADGWDPTTLTAMSGKKVGWRCEQGHTWKTVIAGRSNGSGCPVCSGHQVLFGFNDLATTNPELAEQADGWDPTTLKAGSSKKVGWRCEQGHTWKTKVSHRSSGIGCPSCAQSGFDPNMDGWLYFIDHDGLSMFQVGISNSPDSRLEQHAKRGWEVLEIRGPMEGHLAQDTETAILQAIQRRGGVLGHKAGIEKFDGYSEAWLKDSLQVANIKQLLDWVYEDEN